MYAIGVMAFVILTGLSPFLGDTVQETFAKITDGNFDFDNDEFDDISHNAKSFISNLLVNSMDDRLTAEESLHHPWLRSETKKLMKSLKKDNLKRFLARRRWQKGAQAVLALKRIVCASVVKSSEDDNSSSDEC
jgi:myosin-light-chain kinase